jgi:hypothetical protein
MDASGDFLADTWTWDGVEWAQHDVPGPLGRSNASMAALGETTVLFGGQGQGDAGGTAILADTWLWNGQTWSQANGTGPPTSSSGGAMAPTGGSLVLFGGLGVGGGTGTPSAGMWLWDGTVWTETDPDGTLPGPRASASMASLGSEALLFGGINEGPGPALYGDLWAWGGGPSWTEVSTGVVAPSPGKREDVAVASLGSTLVLFGGMGYATVDDTSVVLGDTWTWDGTSWSQVASDGPAPRASAAVATLGGDIVLFGGLDTSGHVLGDTWTWNGTVWTQQMVSGPSPRSSAAMAGP